MGTAQHEAIIPLPPLPPHTDHFFLEIHKYHHILSHNWDDWYFGILIKLTFKGNIGKNVRYVQFCAMSILSLKRD